MTLSRILRSMLACLIFDVDPLPVSLSSTVTVIPRSTIDRAIAAAVRVAPFFALGNCEELFIVAVLSVSWKRMFHESRFIGL